MTTRIIGTGRALPETVVSNEELAKGMDTSDEWIRSRTGIQERRLAKEETTVSLAAEAGEKALLDAGVTAKELDLILVATITGDHVTPATACEVQAALGAEHALAFDINGACSGFMYALHTADLYLQSGRFHTALVIGAETLSRIMDWQDRSTCVLFGDGAGAAVLKRDETGILAYDLGTDGGRGMVLACRNRLNNNPLISSPAVFEHVHMDGQAVYKFAVQTVPESVKRAVGQAGLSLEEIDCFVLHQANIRIIQAVAKRLQVSEEKFPINLNRCGNISAASIPVLLDEISRKGIVKKGQKVVLCGFGAGLTWGSMVLIW